ncbi:MAG: YxiG family protein [Fusobacteriaceae bacterium]
MASIKSTVKKLDSYVSGSVVEEIVFDMLNNSLEIKLHNRKLKKKIEIKFEKVTSFWYENEFFMDHFRWGLGMYIHSLESGLIADTRENKYNIFLEFLVTEMYLDVEKISYRINKKTFFINLK